MNTDLLLREIEDALVAATKYAEDTHGRILMTKARAKTLIADIRAARSQGAKVTRLNKFNP
jgi:hypothetical protein